jgi:hypothetical protein
MGMNRCFPVPLSLALFGLLASACDTPEDNETNDEAETETETDTGESDSTDGETESGTTSSDDAESSSSSTSDDADTMDTADTGDPECECIAEQEEYEQPMLPLCGEPLCDVVNQVWDDLESDPIVTTPEALECALTALRDRTPGYVQWGSDYNTGQFSEYGYVLIQDDGEAIWREWGANDLTYDASAALRFELPDPSHYDACLANPDAHERYSCLRYPPIPSLAECEAGWSDSGI